MTQRSPIRVGVIGAGLISDIHIRGLRRLSGVEVVAIADSDARRAENKAAMHGISTSYGSATQLLREMAPDCVHILTPPETHAHLSESALEAGAHVYVEKPFAVDVADCERMMNAATRSGRQLCPGHCMVYDPLMQRLLQEIQRDALGDVLHANATYTFDPRRIPGYNSKAWYRQLPGGFLEDLAAHPLSLLVRVIGTPRHVTCATRDEESLAALIAGERGSGTLFVSLSGRPEEVSLEVRGTRASMRADFSAMTLLPSRQLAIPKKLALGVRNLLTAARLTGQTVSTATKLALGRGDTTKGIHSLIAAFYGAIRENGSVPVAAEEGLHVTTVIRSLWPRRAATTQRSSVRFSEGGVKALVTGASGFIGRHLVHTLVGRGIQVRVLVRDGRRAASLHRLGVDAVVGDLADRSTTDGLTDDIDVVFHLASIMRGTHEDFERTDLTGTRRLIDSAIKSGVRRFVFTSTMGAYSLGHLHDGAIVDEGMVDEPERVGPYARAKLLIEGMLRDAQRAGELETVITRPGLVFGPGASPYLTHLPHLGTLVGDSYVVFGDGRVPLQLTYVDNTVDALWRCATVPAASGETFSIVDDRPPTQREYVTQLAQLTDRPLRVVAIPRVAVASLGLTIEALSKIARQAPKTTRRLLLGKTIKLRFDCSRAARVLGWVPQVGWEEGLRRTIEWERSRRERSRYESQEPPVDQESHASPRVRRTTEHV